MNRELRGKLDQVINRLWGGGITDPVTYIEQLSYLIYLKLLDEEEANRELQASMLGNGMTRSLFPDQADRFRWSNWRFRSGDDLMKFLRDEVFPYMASLVREEPQVAEYFRDAVLEITDANLLKFVVDELDQIDFRRLGTDTKGDIFEYFLTHHLGQSALNGQFRTPRQIRTMMVQMVDPDLGDTIFDPAAGTGGFLIDAVEHILAKYSSEPKAVPIYGEEWLDRRGQTIEDAKAQIPTLQTYRKGDPDLLPHGGWERLERSIYGFDVSR